VTRAAFAICLILSIGFALLTSPPASADVLSASQARELSAAIKEAERGSKKRLHYHARRLNDPLARKVLSWFVLFNGGFGTDFEAIDRFISLNPDWPRRTRLLARAEEALSTDTPAEQIIAWFDNRDPVTLAGREKLGGALIKVGRTAAGRALIREAWIEGNFSKDHEKSFFRRHKSHLTQVDHKARAERLMWDGKYWPTRRMIYRVDTSHRKLIEARLALRHQRGNVDRLIRNVPVKYKNDPGLIFDRLRWRRIKERDNAADLFEDLPEAVPYPDKIWRERAILARRHMQMGYISEAYRITSGHRLDASHRSEFADAEWLSGWIALQFLDEPGVAAEHFKRMYDAVRFPVSRARGAYWVGRAKERLGDSDQSEEWYATAARYPTTYYGQLATAQIVPGKGLLLPPEAPISPEIRATFDNHELVRAVRMLAAAGEEKRLFSFITQIATLHDTPEWSNLTARLARFSGRPDLAIRVAKNTLQSHGHFISGGYPTLVPPRLPQKVSHDRPETALVLSIIRQESEFDTDAISHAGARGLMQLMPATAREVSRRSGLKYSKYNLTANPDYNVSLGQTYIANLLESYDGYLPMAIAAYNAGPHRVKQWVERHGDPRDPDVDAVDWIELIPFKETRNYVQRVLENVQVYRLRLADTEVALGLEEDLGQQPQ
jgi:soluble lytic murein transglycosylase